jgi:NDP-sugar pyrophosphorylase family protein
MVLAILAAGEGLRMKTEGITVPKPLVKVGGAPMIERIVRVGVNNGATALYCIANEEANALHEFFSENEFGIPVDLTIRSTPSSLHSLFALAPKLRSQPFCLCTTDTVFRDEEFRRFVSYAQTHVNCDGVLAVTQFVDDENPLCVTMTGDHTITAFSDERSGIQWATGGLYYFSPRVLDMIDDALLSGMSRLRNYLRYLLEKGYLLKGYPFTKMIDVDHVSDVLKAEEFLAALKGIH